MVEPSQRSSFHSVRCHEKQQETMRLRCLEHQNQSSNQHQQQQQLIRPRPGSVLGENEDSSRSSTASSCASSSHGGTDSATSTPQHLNQLSQLFLPRCRKATRLLRPLSRSKSSDISKLVVSHHGGSGGQTALTSTATIIYSSTATLREAQHVTASATSKSSNGGSGPTKSDHLIGAIDNSMKPSSSVTISSISAFDHSGNHPKRSFMSGKSVAKLCGRVFRKSDSMSFPVTTSKSDCFLPNSTTAATLLNTTTSAQQNSNQSNHKTKELLVHNLLLTSTSDSPKGGRNLDSPRDRAESPPVVLSAADVVHLDAVVQALQSPGNDTRPLGDYDSPWDMNRRLSAVVTEIINTPKGEKMPFGFPTPVTSAVHATPTIDQTAPPQVSRPVTTTPTNAMAEGPTGHQEPPAPTETPFTVARPLSAQQTLRTPSEGKNIFSLFTSSRSQGTLASTPPSSGEPVLVIGSGQEAVVVMSTSASNSDTLAHPQLESKPVKPRNLFLPLQCNTIGGSNQTNSEGAFSLDKDIGSSQVKRASLSLDLKISSNSSNYDKTSSPASSLTGADESPRSNVPTFGAPRKKPVLNFGSSILSAVAEDVDVTVSLEKQGWYHGSIARIDAENLLRNLPEGSYLVRNCESAKQDYSLSLKSAKGFMHMKIVKQNDAKFVLGVFSKPFKNIPAMIHHFSINKLPIRGAEHMSLRYPVIDQLL